jgi:ADP-dependent NAD(P)H-hydrate dehydratase / NAD(P)H-hydrate epimerase
MKKNTKQALLSVQEMYRADQITIASGIEGLELMESAGKAITQEILDRWAPCAVVILCGPGNNGGDGFVVARLLKSSGWSVRVLLLGSKDDLKGDAKTNADRWDSEIYPLKSEHLTPCDLVVDAIFGAGLARDVTGDVAETLEAIANMNIPVVAVDIPSGIEGDTGQIKGVSLEADVTVTFCRAKIGHYLLPGRMLCGELVIADIGILDGVIETIAPKVQLNDPNLWIDIYPWPKMDGHKYQRGHGVILGGNQMTGAARLAAMCARRVGAGLITISTTTQSFQIYQQAEAGNLVSCAPIMEILKDPRKNAALAGPGLGIGKNRTSLILSLLETDKNLILDADALTMISKNDGFMWSKRKAQTLLTPHEGEFSRLFPELKGSKIDRARAAALKSGCTILLKGADSVIASPNGNVTINAAGTPWLATAGSGDCLAGICLGFMAQGLSGYEAAQIATWVHGRAAEQIGEGLIAEDIGNILPSVLKELKKVTLLGAFHC